MSPISFITDIIERWRFGDMCRPDQQPPEPEPAPEPVLETPISTPQTITRVGAWVGSSLLADPARTVQAAASAKLDEIHFMVADHSAWRTPHAFIDRPEKGRRVASISKIVEIARLCAEHKITLSLTTWVMPHRRYIEGLGLYFAALARELKSVAPLTEIILDAEEPWTLAEGAGRRAWGTAAANLRAVLAPLQADGVRVGLTGIGYARESALDPLAAWCDFAVPQVYATRDNGLDPRKGPKSFADRWTRKFERREIAIGLAAYKQGAGMMSAALAGAREVAADPNSASCRRVIYWSLPHIRASKNKTRFVAGIKDG